MLTDELSEIVVRPKPDYNGQSLPASHFPQQRPSELTLRYFDAYP